MKFFERTEPAEYTFFENRDKEVYSFNVEVTERKKKPLPGEVDVVSLTKPKKPVFMYYDVIFIKNSGARIQDFLTVLQVNKRSLIFPEGCSLSNFMKVVNTRVDRLWMIAFVAKKTENGAPIQRLVHYDNPEVTLKVMRTIEKIGQEFLAKHKDDLCVATFAANANEHGRIDLYRKYAKEVERVIEGYFVEGDGFRFDLEDSHPARVYIVYNEERIASHSLSRFSDIM